MKHDILHRHRFLRPTYPSTTDDDSIHPTKIDENDDVIVQLLHTYYTPTNADPSEPMTTYDDGAHMRTLDHANFRRHAARTVTKTKRVIVCEEIDAPKRYHFQRSESKGYSC
jgi:hypothetical protein